MNAAVRYPQRMTGLGCRSSRPGVAALVVSAAGQAETERLGAWLTVRLDGGHIGPDLLDVLAPG